MPAFPPIVDSDTSENNGTRPKLLILGSMPGRASLQQQEYYAHPQNSFWWIMSQLFEFDYAASYGEKLSALIRSGVAVWDVLEDCERPGSLDSAIVRESEKANDFHAFLHKYTSIEKIAFNGGAAKTIFLRHCRDVFTQFSHLKFIQLPSTSPAHARINRAEKLEAWRLALITGN